LKQIPVASLIGAESGLELEAVSGKAGLSRTISSFDINRPGLALAGFYKNFADYEFF
jgi:serine kinase of HPr protein (carbohydrate metabolism regulator)